ncbi:MAG: Methionyl-tRNA formyltransferase [Syntrophorhabdaceae bacterium PtaU1.Bin034]|nr:MAG: Methionyl-tRNA formyltransferase [Syntrophorhabdaceae bacterium PtaU1.Bin034]
MKIIFFGSSSFSVPSLKSIYSSVSCVVTKKTKPKGRGYLLEDNEVKRTALSLGLPLIEIDSFKDEQAKQIADFTPDLFVVASFGLIIPKWALEIPAIGPINIHPSLLPKYRGPSPLQWVIWNGETETGVTIIRMNERMDAGDILYQEKVALQPEEDAGTLSDRLSVRASEILPGVIDEVRINGIHGEPQHEDKATYTPMITKEMGRIDWHVGAPEIIRQVRAVVLWPTAFTFLDNKSLKVFKIKPAEDSGTKKAEPGVIVSVSSEGLEVAAGEGSLILKEVQMENRKRMPASEFARGYRQLTGKQLT